MLGPSPSFADLGLRPVVIHALRKMGVESPFPIQAATITDAIAGRDVLGRAPTGSGKTLAFGLPLLHRLSGSASRPQHPRGLILVPTRELALQIDSALEEPALASGLRISSLVGGVPLKRQIDRLGRGVDVVVATPGRLEDLVSAGHLSLAQITTTVVDEADRMSDLGFLPQVTALLKRIPAGGQTMLFSATLDGDVDELIRRHLDNPVLHSAEPPAVEAADHHFFRVTQQDKTSVAAAIAAREGKTIMFLRTKHAVDRFTESLLAVGVSAAALHGDKTQANRTRTLAQFADGSVPVLVATDVAARGIDVDHVSLVVHVDPPEDAKDYTHRAGRTARAGRGGTVVTLVTESQVERFRAVAGQSRIGIDVVDVGPTSPLLRATTGARQPPGPPPPTNEGPTAGTRSAARPGSARSGSARSKSRVKSPTHRSRRTGRR
ncbi:MAG: DEAD/DEAH box helicase [Rhodococcus sp. (in: high G+C Gram-positive bacteria)]